MNVKSEAWMQLSIKETVGIYIYYIILLILGILISVFIITSITNTPNIDVISYAIYGSLAMSSIGASSYYIRKLYKSCIRNEIASPANEFSDKLKKIGTIVYLIIRPIFALGFSILVVVGLNAGKITIVGKGILLNNGFIFICMFVSFFVGFSSGKLIKGLEKKGGSWISTFLGVTVEKENNE